MTKKKVLIISFSDLIYDGRVTRQIDSLKNEYDVDVAAFSNNESEGFNFIEVPKTNLTLSRKLWTAFFLLFKFFRKAYWLLHDYKSLGKELKKQNYDFIIGNDIESLPLAFLIHDKVFFDAHEYAPRHYEEKWVWRLLFQPLNIFLCKKYIPKVLEMFTVCDGLAVEYDKHFNRKPVILTNAPSYQEYSAESIERPKGIVKMVHHGIINVSRKPHKMLELIALLGDGYSLDLMFVKPEYVSSQTEDYIKQFYRDVEEMPNVRLVDPVKSNQIVPTIMKYDFGIFLLEPVNFNYQNALPNKLFEFIQARIATAIGPSPEMSKIVEKYKCGVVSHTFESQSLADAIVALSKDDILKMKQNADNAARELNAEQNEVLFRRIINKKLK